jgi:hypothetical protein
MFNKKKEEDVTVISSLSEIPFFKNTNRLLINIEHLEEEEVFIFGGDGSHPWNENSKDFKMFGIHAFDLNKLYLMNKNNSDKVLQYAGKFSRLFFNIKVREFVRFEEKYNMLGYFYFDIHGLPSPYFDSLSRENSEEIQPYGFVSMNISLDEKNYKRFKKKCQLPGKTLLDIEYKKFEDEQSLREKYNFSSVHSNNKVEFYISRINLISSSVNKLNR